MLYLLLWLALPKPSFWGLDNGFKYQGARAFAETGSIAIPYLGGRFDPDGDFRPIVPPFSVIKDGRLLPVFSPLFLVFGGILYKLFGAIGLYILPLLGGWACLWTGWFAWRGVYPKNNPSPYILLLGLGTPLLFYSLSLWEHSVAAALVLLSFGLVVKREDEASWFLILAGFSAAVASGFRTEAIFPALAVVFLWYYTGRGESDWLKFVLGLVIGLVLVGVVNWWQTGVPLPINIAANLKASPISSIRITFLSRVYNGYVLMGQGFSSTFRSLILIIPLMLAVTFFRWMRVKWVWHAVAAMVLMASVIYIRAAAGADNPPGWTSRSGGLLWVSPIFAISLLPLGGRVRRAEGLLWLTGMGTILFTALGLPHADGVHWGPRFIIMILPLLLILASIRFITWWHRSPHTRWFLVVLIAASLFNQAYSAHLLWRTKQENRTLNSWMSEIAAQDMPVVTDVPWLPGDCSLGSYNRPWFIFSDQRGIQKLFGEFRRQGIKQAYVLEKPPYITRDQYYWVGAELMGEEYFLEGRGDLRRTRVRILR